MNFGALGFVLVPAMIAALLSLLYRCQRNSGCPYWTMGYLYLLVHLGTNMQSGLLATSIFPFFVVGSLILLRIGIGTDDRATP